MRDPVLFEYSRLTAKHDIDADMDPKECSECRTRNSEFKIMGVFVDANFNFITPGKADADMNLIWASDIELTKSELLFELKKVPATINIEDKIQEQLTDFVSNITGSDKSDIEQIEWQQPESPGELNPNITIDIFQSIAEEMGFHEKDGELNKSNIGSIILEEKPFKPQFSEGFDFQTFNDKFAEILSKRAKEHYNSLDNPYSQLIELDDISSFFVKHGEDAVEFWNTYKDSIFKCNPLIDNNGHIDQLVRDELERMSILELWYDLMESIRFELVKPTEDAREYYRDLIRDECGIEDVYIPWLNREYYYVGNEIVSNYDPDDFGYGKSGIQSGSKICVPTDGLCVIYETIKYGKCMELSGGLIPEGWVVKPVGVTTQDVSDSYGRDEMYQLLKEIPDQRYLTYEEVRDHEMCVDSDLKPIVRDGGEYDQTHSMINKGERYHNRIRDAVEDGYDMQTLRLSDFIGSKDWSGGYDGWHTGTICSEFPFFASVEDCGEPHRNGDFSSSGAVSYKTTDELTISPDWNSILGTKTSDLSEEEIKNLLEDSDYSTDDKVVVTFHNLP